MDWAEARARLGAPIYAPLSAALEKLPADRWPTHAELDALAAGAATRSGAPIRFVPPRGAGEGERRYYELRIFESGEIETRPRNWHDLFNALAWATFPRAKATINAQHAAILEERGAAEARRRSPERDALTLFDEGGIVVATNSARIRELVAAHEWKALFWSERGNLEASARFLAFGHALYEKGLDPYPGIVAKAVFVPHSKGFLDKPASEQAGEADARLAEHFNERGSFATPKAMPVLPVFGIPGWHPSTGQASFYDDAGYFRPKR